MEHENITTTLFESRMTFDKTNFSNIDMELDEYHEIDTELLNSCRICGETKSNGIEIFMELGLKEKMNLILPITVEKDDVFSHKICTDCYKTLELAYSLIATCLRTDIKFKRIFNKEQMQEQCPSIPVLEESSNTPVVLEKQCGHCKAIYSTKKELIIHINELHQGKVLFKCLKCDRTYEKWSSLDVHEATHRTDKPHLCDLCGKSFKHSNNLRGHKRIHLDESKKKRHVCEICKTAFRSRFHLREHTNQHEGKRPYSCEECSKEFFKRIQLRQHKLSHQSNKHLCPVCGLGFNRKGNMNAHLKRHDCENNTYTCSICLYKTKSMSELKAHRKTHTEEEIIESVKMKCINKTIWECKICDKIFQRESLLLNHERKHNNNVGNIKCDECDKQLSSKSSLLYHKKCIHSTIKPYGCKFCKKSYVTKEGRLIHERIHTGERPYRCNVCDIKYTCSSNLNQHMKIHCLVKPYVCQYCGKGFTRKGALRVHEKIHKGIKDFSCQVCQRSFTQKNDMLKHLKIHDNAKRMRCDQCDETFYARKDILKHMSVHVVNENNI